MPRRYRPARRLPLRAAPPALLLLLLLAVGPGLGADVPASPGARIDAILNEGKAASALWGVYVQNLNTGQEIYGYNADKALMPASNQKLLTTAAALDALGPTYRFETGLYFDGAVSGSVMQGDLILRGAGDPTFGSIETGGGDPLRHWAQELARMGVTRVEGRIIGDDDAQSDLPYAEGWDVSYILNEYYAPSSGALTYHDNVVRVQVSNTGADSVGVAMMPTDYLRVRSVLEASSRRRGRALHFDRAFGEDAITLRGSLPRGYRGTVAVPVANPTAFALHSFEHHLTNAGIEVAARTVDVDDLPESPDYDEARLLFLHVSPPLSEILSITNKESNNLYAEQLFRTVGWGGTTAGGEQRLKSLLSRAGVEGSAVAAFDGSGLSRKDLITPRAMGALLAHMYTHPHRDTFLASLPSGGEPRTTMQGRLGGLPVQAKTGSLMGVRALSGYTRLADGTPVAFVVFANNFTGSPHGVTPVIDRVVAELSSATP